ncbi:MAG: hypothetical protein Q8K56_01245, partial [Rhodoglobus sp.]|nr:hypothetical protein [Rhodoglobus sp.]
MVLEGFVIARAAASVILAGVLLTGTAGCTFITTRQTRAAYDPGDGVNATIGTIGLRNTVALVGTDGQAVSLLVSIFNNGDKAVKVNLGYDVDGSQKTQSVVIGAGKVGHFGYESADSKSQIIISGTGVKAGELLPLFVQYGEETGQTILVPVLDGSLPQYADLIAPDV